MKMPRHRLVPHRPHHILLAISLLIIAVVALNALFAPGYGAQLGDRALKMSSEAAGAVTIYELDMQLSTSGAIGSIQIQFCSNNPLPDDPCTTPNGMDVSTASLVSQTGETGFTIATASDSHTLILTRAPSAAVAGPVTYRFDNVTNPSDAGSYFARVQTFASTDASGPASDYGGIAFPILSDLSVSATVPPFLLFCTGVSIPGMNCSNAVGDYIDFGELSSTRAISGSSQMLVGTNAVDGYNISVAGTTLTSGSNVIDALASNDVSRPGTAQFGFNLRANSAPASGINPQGPGTGVPLAPYNQPNSFRFANGDTLVTNAAPDDMRLYTATYLVNVPRTQAAGVYVTTLTYVCLANF